MIILHHDVIRSVKVPQFLRRRARICARRRIPCAKTGHVKAEGRPQSRRRDTLVTLLPLLQRFLLGDPAPTSRPNGRFSFSMPAPGAGASCDISSPARTLAIIDSCRRWRACSAAKILMMIGRASPGLDRQSSGAPAQANTPWRVGSKAISFVIATAGATCRNGSVQGRVQVDLTVLQRWYRHLGPSHHQPGQTSKWPCTVACADLFHFQPDLVFYDLTSTYFEGHGRPIWLSTGTVATVSGAMCKWW